MRGCGVQAAGDTTCCGSRAAPAVFDRSAARLGLDHADTWLLPVRVGGGLPGRQAFGRGHGASPADLDRSAGHAGAGAPGHAGHQVEQSPREMAARGDHAGAEDLFRECSRPAAELGVDLPARWPPGSAFPGDGGAWRSCRRRGSSGCVLGPAADPGPGSPGHAGYPVQRRPGMAARGDHAGAEDLFRCVFAARQRTLGADHPDTLIAWFSIAQEMAAAGDHAGGGPVPGCVRGPAADAGRGSPDTLALGSALPRKWRRAAIMPGGERVPGCAGRTDANLGLGSSGHADRPVRALPGRWRRAGTMPGGGRVAGSAAAFRAEAGRGSSGHAGHPVRDCPGDGGARRSCRGRGPVPGSVRDPAADAGRGSPGHADRLVQHCPGDGSGRRSCRGGGRIQGSAAAPAARLGPDHPDTLATGSSIARRWRRAGTMPAAEDEFRDVLPTWSGG